MIVTLFWSRLRPDMTEEEHQAYQSDFSNMLAQAEQMPGFLSFKAFTAEDGERLSVIQFESEETQRAWRTHAEHRIIQQRGRDSYYDRYRIVVGQAEKDHSWQRG